MKKRKFCEGVIAFAASSGTSVLFSLSFLAVLHVGASWLAADYWLVWFAVFSFIAGCVGFIISVVAVAGFLDGICEG